MGKCETSECRNTAGSYKCGCPDGFNLHNAYQECVDANECLDSQQSDGNSVCGSAKCQNSFGSFSCLCPSGYSYNNNLQVCIQSASGCGEAECAFGCNALGSTGFECQCPKGHQAVTGSRGQVSHCVAINSVDDFLTDNESEDKDIISTEGCFACQMNSRPRGGRARFSSYRSTRTRTRNRHYQRKQRSSSRTTRRTRRHLISASFTSQRPMTFAMDNFIKNDRMNSSLSKQYTKLSIRLKSGQTKHKRPILFIVPAEASNSKLTYSLHGKDKDLFGLREESDGIQALFYKQKVSSVIQDSSVIHHHIRVIGQKARHARHEHNSKDLNMKIKIAVLAQTTL